MNEEELDKLGRTMAGVLRHFPERYGLRMDKHGWIDLEEFINMVRKKQRRFRWLKPHHVLAIIDTDPKGRYQFRDGMIRATYAHSVDVDLDLPTRGTPDLLFYPTTEEEKDILLETGLMPSDRKRVHLSKTIESAIIAGKVRCPEPLIFEVNTKAMVEAEIVIKKAGNTVFVVDSVPPEYLRLMEPEEVPIIDEEPGGKRPPAEPVEPVEPPASE
ncbi:MAG: RNA 2'-phosphotransferase [Candidatus Thermoplasmatota archaeon]|nr:RNA 2'-phosphotransferase [Euryarchaeota archaeon]MBU4032553.1 RNA 2'-phosphotransferase [Candidatus Thermoplasmatota archaeon]MBU4072026.1 RNA 2'-phosphotransferase [Candidatus Thermoplasmatota archaeon]MBU4144557.1 RNA 2'-phosphotransferase [Candidatus Thermoplasmatota archaeon]MBU4592106.1 RNA 2'-phosphotransferase [Candidatus Thermoplasmatota archaeon]